MRAKQLWKSTRQHFDPPPSRRQSSLSCRLADLSKKIRHTQHPNELEHHRCLIAERFGEPLNKWRFIIDGKVHTLKIHPALTTNDSAILRQWALSGSGIIYKSISDMKSELDDGKLVPILCDFVFGFQDSDHNTTRLQFVYPSRRFLPRRVEVFMDFFKTFLKN